MKNIVRFRFEITNPDKFLFYKLSQFIRMIDYYPLSNFNLQITKTDVKDFSGSNNILKQCHNEMTNSFNSEIKQFNEEREKHLK